MIIAIYWKPNDRNLYAELRVVPFEDVTLSQVHAYLDELPDTCTGYAIDTTQPNPYRCLGVNGKSAADLYNALGIAGDARIECFKHGRDEAERRIGDRIVRRAAEAQPITFHPIAPHGGARSEHDEVMIKTADHFVSTVFCGYPKMYDSTRSNSLDDARKIAVSLFQDRPVAIYAIRGNRQIHVENCDPQNRRTYMSTAEEKAVASEAKKTEREAAKLAKAQEAEAAKAAKHAERDAAKAEKESAAAEVKAAKQAERDAKRIAKEQAAAEKAANAGAPRAPRTDKALEAAKQGVMPTAPDFSANTHKPWRKKLDALTNLVANRDVNGLRAFEVNPISTSPRALVKYRDCAIAAIEATMQQAAE